MDSTMTNALISPIPLLFDADLSIRGDFPHRTGPCLQVAQRLKYLIDDRQCGLPSPAKGTNQKYCMPDLVFSYLMRQMRDNCFSHQTHRLSSA
eukprot:scaffold187482_cov18-Prasinocladus_malaysianus.AAC.1